MYLFSTVDVTTFLSSVPMKFATSFCLISVFSVFKRKLWNYQKVFIDIGIYRFLKRELCWHKMGIFVWHFLYDNVTYALHYLLYNLFSITLSQWWAQLHVSVCNDSWRKVWNVSGINIVNKKNICTVRFQLGWLTTSAFGISCSSSVWQISRLEMLPACD